MQKADSTHLQTSPHSNRTPTASNQPVAYTCGGEWSTAREGDRDDSAPLCETILTLYLTHTPIPSTDCGQRNDIRPKGAPDDGDGDGNDDDDDGRVAVD